MLCCFKIENIISTFYKNNEIKCNNLLESMSFDYLLLN